MAQTCTICRHSKRQDIDEALLSGEPLRTISDRFGPSKTSLIRHRNEHLPATLATAKQAANEVQAETLFARLKKINRETAAVLAEARLSQNHVVALQAISRVEKQIELEARLLGELSESTKVAVGITVTPPQGPIPVEALRSIPTDKLMQIRAILAEAVEAGAQPKQIDSEGPPQM